ISWCIFFFSSRRRHTRCYRDWSSDVCSSDLGLAVPGDAKDRVRSLVPDVWRLDVPLAVPRLDGVVRQDAERRDDVIGEVLVLVEIGRASCRGREECGGGGAGGEALCLARATV